MQSSLKPDYGAFFRFAQRPFSLTPDPKFYFRSRSHSRVFDALSAAIARRESLMLVVGDLGVGKTTLCRTLLDLQERKSRAALVGNALLSPEDLLRLMLQDLGALSKEDVKQGRLGGANRVELVDMFDRFLDQLRASNSGAVMIIDEAHSLPPATRDQVIEIASLEANRVESTMIQSAASALDLIHLRPKRFRWYGTR
ncbi:MAG: AAA family ATPase [Betaproteobacteria bacterium]